MGSSARCGVTRVMIEPDPPLPLAKKVLAVSVRALTHDEFPVAANAELPDGMSLLGLLREDRRTNGFSIMASGFHAVAVHRFGVWTLARTRPARLILTPIYKTLFGLVKTVDGIEIPRSVKVGRRLRIGHQGGVVIHPFAVIGDDCLIRQNVSVAGYSMVETRWLREAPTIGNRVSLGVGSVIMGRITIGDGARIGPNVVVSRDVPPGAMLSVDPPRTILPRFQPGHSADARTDR